MALHISEKLDSLTVIPIQWNDVNLRCDSGVDGPDILCAEGSCMLRGRSGFLRTGVDAPALPGASVVRKKGRILLVGSAADRPTDQKEQELDTEESLYHWDRQIDPLSPVLLHAARILLQELAVRRRRRCHLRPLELCCPQQKIWTQLSCFGFSCLFPV